MAARSWRLVALLLLQAVLAAKAMALNCRALDAPVRATVCTVSLEVDQLRLFWSDPAGRPLRTFPALKQMLDTAHTRLRLAMNAGMYEADGSPVGLLVSGGKEYSPLNVKSGAGNFYLKPNGVFYVSKGHARIVTTDAYRHARPAHVELATQSGPLLVIGGMIPLTFKVDSASRTTRNGVGITRGGLIVLAISDAPVNLYEFASLFRDTLGCQDALYLDGSVSSLYAPPARPLMDSPDLGPLLAVVE
jgi:uncharacterized protein YigE (DUF2233 family)